MVADTFNTPGLRFELQESEDPTCSKNTNIHKVWVCFCSSLNDMVLSSSIYFLEVVRLILSRNNNITNTFLSIGWFNVEVKRMIFNEYFL